MLTAPLVPAPPPRIVSVEVALPFGVRLTRSGYTDQTVHGKGHIGDSAKRDTLPAKPLRLVKVIVEVLLDWDRTMTLEGLAEMEKSGLVEGTVK